MATANGMHFSDPGLGPGAELLQASWCGFAEVKKKGCCPCLCNLTCFELSQVFTLYDQVPCSRPDRRPRNNE